MTQPVPVPTPPPGDPAPPTPPVPKPPADPPKTDDCEGGDNRRGGDRAVLADLAKERDKRQQLERQVAELSPLKQLADLISGGQKPPEGKSEVDLLKEKFAELERTANDERAARWRIEVAQAKNLTTEQAAWLSGASREELEASADKLLAAFPAGPRTPLPDPSQGARGGTPGPDIDAQVAEARSKGDYRRAIALERQKLTGVSRPT